MDTDIEKTIAFSPTGKSIYNCVNCTKCSSIQDFTLFNSSNQVKLFSECDNKHINLYFLDDYIKKIISKSMENNDSEIICEKCQKKKEIKICQFCNKYLCGDCNIKHLCKDHILNSRIVEEIYDINSYFDNIEEKDDKLKVMEDKLSKAIKYIKEIEEYFKKLENNFIKFMIKNYLENKNESKLLHNIDFLLQLNNLDLNTNDFNKFLLNNNNNILNSCRYKGDKINDEFEGKGEMIYFNGKYDGEWKKGQREGFGIYKYINGEKYIGEWKNDLEEGNGRYLYKNGDIYDGYFIGGKRNGKGLYKKKWKRII